MWFYALTWEEFQLAGEGENNNQIRRLSKGKFSSMDLQARRFGFSAPCRLQYAASPTSVFSFFRRFNSMKKTKYAFLFLALVARAVPVCCQSDSAGAGAEER